MHQPIRIDRVGFLLLAVDRIVLHLDAHFFPDRFHQNSNRLLMLIQFFRCVGPDADHRVETVEKLDVLSRKRAFDFLKRRSDVAREGRGSQIDDKLLAEIKRGRFRQRKAGQRKTFVFVAQTPINFAVVTLIVERKAGLHERRKIAADRLGRDHMAVGQIQYRCPARGFNLFENGPLPDQLRVPPHCPSPPRYGRGVMKTSIINSSAATFLTPCSWPGLAITAWPEPSSSSSPAMWNN